MYFTCTLHIDLTAKIDNQHVLHAGGHFNVKHDGLSSCNIILICTGNGKLCQRFTEETAGN